MSILLVAFTLISVSPEYSSQATIRLDTDFTYQTIVGWEAESQSGEVECEGFELYKDLVFDMAVDDLGINRIRLAIRSGIENPEDWFSKYMKGEIDREQYKANWYEVINDDADPHHFNPAGFQYAYLDYKIESVVLPLRNRLLRNGDSLFVNVNYVDFRPSEFKHKSDPQEYAEFVLATYQHIQSKYGFTPDSWEVILEPENAKWSPEQIGHAIVAAGDLLKANGFTPNFIAPSTTVMKNAIFYFEKILAIPGAVDYMSELSYHRYSGVSRESLETIAHLAEENKINTSMLELIGATYETLHEDLKIGNNSAWQQFALAFCVKDNGAQYFWIDNSNPGNPIVHSGKRTNYLRQYFKFIHRGAIRIESTTTNPSFDPLSFINPGDLLVVVIKADKAGEILVQGLSVGTYEISYISRNESHKLALVKLEETDETLTTAIPAAGVITIYQTGLAGVQQSEYSVECK